ncbi:signal peptidase I [Clostridium sp. CAG:277]|nr:signal peptidase I [Clostridium sp. CAG:277]
MSSGTAGQGQMKSMQGNFAQSVRTQQSVSRQTAMPQAQGQNRPAQRDISGQTRRSQQTQPVRSQQPQSGQAVMPQAPGQSRPMQQNMSGQVTSAQQPSGQIKSGQNIQPQSVSGQVMRAQQTQPAESQQLRSGQTVMPQAPGQSRQIQQNTPGQPASMQQSVLPQGQITRQSIPDQTPIPSVDANVTEAQQPELQQAEVPKPEKTQKEHLISVSTSTSRPVRSKSSALETISEETKPMDEEQDHTVEITIKLDVAGIKKKFSDLKKKLAPEERTLEDVNAAMEQNRQLQAEKQQENSETAAQKGAELAHKAASTASGIGKKVTGLLRKRQESAATLEGEAVTAEGDMINPVDGQAVDGQIVQLEGEAVEENRFAEKIQDLKEVIPQKAGKASHLLTNIIIIAFCIGIAYFLASFVTNYVAYQTPVEGESMEPTLTDGDSVVIQRLSYYFTDPKRYDVVVFPVNYDSESQEKTYYIKRVIGLPGETVQIIDGSVYINNEKLTDDKYSSTTINEAGIAENPLVLGENQYFVMGDNRNMSTDSRNSYVGLVNKNDIVGEAWICTWPLTHFGGLK